MTVDINEFRAYLSIDKSSLDDEVIRQPSLFFEVSEAYVEAAAERDYAKEDLANIDAVLDSSIRKKLSDKKPTEGAVKGLVQCSEEHSKAMRVYLEAKQLADKFAVLKDAFQQRSYMLRDLVSLHTSNYFQDSSVKITLQQDKSVYTQRRARLAMARESK